METFFLIVGNGDGASGPIAFILWIVFVLYAALGVLWTYIAAFVRPAKHDG